MCKYSRLAKYNDKPHIYHENNKETIMDSRRSLSL